LNRFERHTFGLGHQEQGPEQLHEHHYGVEGECMASGAAGDQRKRPGDQSGHDPVSRASQRLPLGANAVRKDLADEDPDHRSLSERVRRDEHEQTC